MRYNVVILILTVVVLVLISVLIFTASVQYGYRAPAFSSDPVKVVEKKYESDELKQLTAENKTAAKSPDSVLTLTNCFDRERRRQFELRGEFWVLYNYVQSTIYHKCHEAVTYTTHGDYTFLDNLEPLVDRWNGPISLALYAPGDDFETCLKSIAYLRNCRRPSIKKFVTFHLFFDAEHFPKKDFVIPFTHLYEDIYDCNRKPPYLSKNKETYKNKNNLTYPINVARNVARETALTYFVLASDIELYPTRNFTQKFLEMIVKYPDHQQRDKPRVYVLPIFEVTYEARIPESKTELQLMFKSDEAFLFHSKICPSCHRITHDDEWVEAKETKGLNVYTVGKRLKYNKKWEAFYVGTHDDPLFDERLTWEGQSNKMTQAFIMCLLDYDYMILDNAFLTHKPGIKKKKIQMINYAKIVNRTNAMIKNVIMPELFQIYGSKDGCVLK